MLASFRAFRASVALFALVGAGLLAGCGSISSLQDVSGELPGVAISGKVHGGAYPIQSATVRLMETQVGSTLNGGNASTYTSAAKVLESRTSDSRGYFSFDTNWTCTSGQYAYMTVTGGQTVSGKTNNNVIQVGVIGSCDKLNANVANVNVFLSELSTVAAAYTLRNFIAISPNDGSGTQQVNISAPPANLATGACTGTGTAMTCTGAGIAHGFANAINLVDSVRFDGSFPSGQANASFVLTTNAQAVVPQAMINTLGNILQTCVDSAGVTTSSSISSTSSDGTLCGNLFEYATPPVSGASSPLNTLQAILNIAQYPTNNVNNLYLLQPRNVFFTPTLASDTMSTGTVSASSSAREGSATAMASTSTATCASQASACVAYTLAVFYTGNGTTTGGKLQTIATPIDVALDAADNAYVLYTDVAGSSSTYGAISAFGPAGLGLYPDVRSTSLLNPMAIAVDNVNTAWATSDTATGNLLGFSTTSGALTQTLAIANGYPAGLAVGLANDIWISRDSADSNQTFFRYAPSSNGSSTTYSSTAFNTTPAVGASIKRLALTYPQNLYGVTSGSTAASQAIRFPYAKDAAATVYASATLGASGGSGIMIGKYMAPNNGQEAFFPLSGEMDSTNAPDHAIQANSDSGGSMTGLASKVPSSAAIDGAGELFWTDNEAAGQIYRMVLSTGNTATTSTSVNNGTVMSFTPCFVTASTSYNCHIPSGGTNLRGAAIDSSGAMWSLANDTDFTVMQVFGVATPSYPLLLYGHGAVVVQ